MRALKKLEEEAVYTTRHKEPSIHNIKCISPGGIFNLARVKHYGQRFYEQLEENTNFPALISHLIFVAQHVFKYNMCWQRDHALKSSSGLMEDVIVMRETGLLLLQKYS